MIVFNLHPLRKQERLKENKIIKKYLSAGLIFSLLIWLAAHAQLVHYKQRTLNQIASMEKKLRHHELKVAALPAAGQDFFIQKLMAAIGFFSPFGVCFTAINQSENAVEFYGKASSSEEFRLFLLNWKAASLFSHIEIKNIEQQANGLSFIFAGWREE